MSYWPHLMAAMVGAGLTVQVGMNATVRFAIGSPALAAIVRAFGPEVLDADCAPVPDAVERTREIADRCPFSLARDAR